MTLTVGDYVKSMALLPKLQEQLAQDTRPFASLPMFCRDAGCWLSVTLHRDGVFAIVPDDAFPKLITPSVYYTQESSRKLYQDMAMPTADSEQLEATRLRPYTVTYQLRIWGFGQIPSRSMRIEAVAPQDAADRARRILLSISPPISLPEWWPQSLWWKILHIAPVDQPTDLWYPVWSDLLKAQPKAS